jgi:hypothetical protein
MALVFSCNLPALSLLPLPSPWIFALLPWGRAHLIRGERIFIQLTSFSSFSSRLISRLTHEQTTFLKKGDMPVKTGVITH